MKTNSIYHIYNRCNGNEKMFIEERNYAFFLKQIQKYILPVADIISFCLMPNHFHFLLRIKSEDEIREAFPKFKDLEKFDQNLKPFISKQFSKLFSSYTQSFNKVYNRKGSMFMKNFKRKEVNDPVYFSTLIFYIHTNPIHHNYISKMNEWKWSSFRYFFRKNSFIVSTGYAIEHFGSLERFDEFHQLRLRYFDIKEESKLGKLFLPGKPIASKV